MKKIFATQGEDEEVRVVLNKHVFVLLKEIWLPIVLCLTAFCGMLFYFYVPYFFLVSFACFVLFLTWIFYGYFVWSRDRFIITNRRIIDFEQSGLFRTSQKEAGYDKIQDVTVDIKNIFGSLFNFGSVSISTASNTTLVLADIKKPVEVQKIIFSLMQEYASQNNGGIDEKMVRELLALLKKTNNTPE
ncbi:MAG: PH domain-containing protein [Patescibacteria group bacterium]